MSLFDRKVEDLQFRVEEACITKGDLEVTPAYVTCCSIKHLLPRAEHSTASQTHDSLMKLRCELLTQ